MLYRLVEEDVEPGPLIDDGRVTVCVPNPDSDAVGLSPDCEFLMWNYVENADFHNIFMHRDGTVLFYGTGGPRVLIDRLTLDTGRVLLVEFGHDGRVEACCRVRPCILYEFWALIQNLGKSVRAVMSSEVWKSQTYNGP